MPDSYHVFCGDRRQFWAVEQLRARGCVVLTHGVPGAADWPLPAQLGGTLLLPFPSFQGEFLRGKDGLPVAELLRRIRPGVRVFGGLLGGRRAAFEAAGAVVSDLYGSEPLTTLNAIPTAEGAIHLAIGNSSITLHGASCLVIGFGRVGRVLAQKLHALSALVTVAARKPADRAMAEAMGLHSQSTDGCGSDWRQYDFIFNTVPAPVLTAQQLGALKSSCILIELASKPGGLQEADCRVLGLAYHFAPGLPGLCAPETAGRLYADCVLDFMEEK